MILDLTHLFPMHPMPNLWKHQKTLHGFMFSGVEKECIGSEWVKIFIFVQKVA